MRFLPFLNHLPSLSPPKVRRM